jgi:hypothetical protein
LLAKSALRKVSFSSVTDWSFFCKFWITSSRAFVSLFWSSIPASSWLTLSSKASYCSNFFYNLALISAASSYLSNCRSFSANLSVKLITWVESLVLVSRSFTN